MHDARPNRITSLFGLSMVILVGATSVPPQAIAQVSGSAESLRIALRSPGTQTSSRRDAVMAATRSISGLSDLKYAITLKDWRDQDPDSMIHEVDREARRYLVRQFERNVHEYLTRGDAGTRLAVIGMIAELGTTTRGCEGRRALASYFAADLAERARNGEVEERFAAVHALAQIHPDLNIALPVFNEVRSHDDPRLRAAALDSLGIWVQSVAKLSVKERSMEGIDATRADFVAVASAAVPLAGNGCEDSQVEVRRFALRVITNSAAGLRKLVDDGLNLASFDGSPTENKTKDAIKSEALPLLLALRQQASIVSKSLADVDVEVRLSARQALEDMAVPQLRLLTAQGSMLALMNHQPGTENDPIVDGLRGLSEALAAGLSDKDVRSRRAAVDVLESLGPCAVPALPTLAKALEDPDRFVRWPAARTLGKIGAADPKVSVPALAKLLDDSDLDLRLTAVSALERMGKTAFPALDAVVKAAGSKDAELRMACLRLLAAIGTESFNQILPALKVGLTDPEARVRKLSVELLGQFGPTAEAALPDLQMLLRDKQPEVSQASREAILRVRK